MRATGFREDIPAVLREADLFVLSSLYEGFGLVLLEAMAARLPVIATKVGPVPEVVLDEATGLLVPPADPEALAAALSRLLVAHELGRMMGNADRQRVENSISADKMARSTEKLYDELLSSRVAK
jgi:glycosyltransferase involved in cell wall biosynthesis